MYQLKTPLDEVAQVMTALGEGVDIRSNLTLREHVAPLSRRTWSLAHDQLHLWLHIQWGLTYYPDERPCQGFSTIKRSFANQEAGENARSEATTQVSRQ
jgi:hypothetical protein